MVLIDLGITKKTKRLGNILNWPFYCVPWPEVPQSKERGVAVLKAVGGIL